MSLPAFVQRYPEMVKTEPRYLDDFPVGTVWESPSFTLSHRQAREFAELYDPQPFHLDAEEAAKSPFGRLVVSGWNTAAVAMRLLVESGAMGRTGFLGLGVDELRWPAATLPGDTLTLRAEVIANTLGRSGRSGTIRVRCTVTNQRREIAMSFIPIVRMPVRES